MVVVLDTFTKNIFQKAEEVLYTSDSITIYYNPEHQWLYNEWIGYQNLYTISLNGNLILRYLQEKNCTKILNNNQRVQGFWHDACHYLAEELLPQLTNAGLKYLAWVQSPNLNSQYSTEQIMEAISLPMKDQINIFHSLPVAKEWLKNV